jgi:molybdopterin-guanine dinucleotide biosynthesis protein B
MGRKPRVLAIVGPSGSGKTTLLTSLIRMLAARGNTIAVIKHTHHDLNEERRGDTGRFLDEGALPVILAAANEAVVFGPHPSRITYQSPLDLLDHCDTETVLVEGFKSFEGWPRMDVTKNRDAEDALALLDRIA